MLMFICMIGIATAVKDNYWNFEDGSGATLDDQWGSVDADITNITTFFNTSVPIFNISGDGGSYSGFYDDDAIVDHKTLTIASNSITFSVWFKRSLLDSASTIFSRWTTSSDTNTFRANINIDNDLEDIYSSSWHKIKTINDKDWHFFVMRQNGGETSYWVDGVKELTAVNGFGTNAQPLYSGGVLPGNHDWNGNIDEFKIFNRSISDLEISNLYNYGTLDFDPADVYLNNVILVNEDLIEYVSISENDNFYVFNNFTKNGVSFENSTCEFNALNINVHFANESNNNFTLSDNTISLELAINEGVTNLIDDVIEFSVCKTDKKIPVQIYVNNVLHHIINKDIIPKCNIGTHNEINITTAYIGNNENNISIRCADCNGGNKQIVIARDKYNDLLHFDRRFNNHTENLTFNATSQLYEYTNHLYHFKESGDNQNIFINCDNNITQFSYNISNVNLSVNLISVNDLSFINGANIEASEEYNFIFDITGDFVTFFEINFSYGNGTLINNYSNEYVNISNLLINGEGIYNISVSAIDDELTETFKQFYFIINDTTNPTIAWNNPSILNISSYILNVEQFLDFSFYDINLFAYEVLIYNPSGTLVINHTLTEITTPSRNLIFSYIPNVTGTWLVNATVLDDHTKEEIPPYDNEIIDNKKIKFKFKKIKVNKELYYNNVSIQYRGKYDLMDVHTTKFKDRYKFYFDTRLDGDKFIKKVKQDFRVECKNIIYRSDSKFTAHFICPTTQNWVDFENEDILSYTVDSCGTDCYDVSLTMNPIELLEFNSIGGLNIISQQATFEVSVASVTEPSLSLTNLNTNNLSHMVFLGILILIWLGVNLIGMAFNDNNFMFFGFIIGVIIGLMLINVSGIFTMLFTLCNFGIFFSRITAK